MTPCWAPRRRGAFLMPRYVYPCRSPPRRGRPRGEDGYKRWPQGVRRKGEKSIVHNSSTVTGRGGLLYTVRHYGEAICPAQGGGLNLRFGKPTLRPRVTAIH